MADWARFLEWYGGRRVRLSGRPPAQTTLRGKCSRLNTAMRYSGVNTPEALEALVGNRQACEVLLDKLYANLAPGSVALVVNALRDLGEWAKARGVIEDVALTSADVPRWSRRKAIQVYTPDEVEALVGAARGVSLRFWAYLMTLAETGRRASEALDLRYDQLHLDADPPYFDLDRTKNGTPQYVPLTRRLAREVYTPAVLDRLRAGPTHYARPVTEYPFPWNYATPHGTFEAMCERTGLRYLGFHGFRHTKATAMLTRGVPIQAVASLLGHASITTTERVYDHSDALHYAHYLND